MTHDDLAGEPFLRAASASLGRTRVEATLDVPLSDGKNVLYAGTFGLAWAALEALAGGPAEIEGVPGFGERVRRAACGPEDLDEEAYVARAVVGEKGLEELRAELARKFGGAASPKLLPASLGDEAMLVYAYLFKNLALATPLGRNLPPPLVFAGVRVASFGVTETPDKALWEARAKQIVVHDHRSDEDFVLELVTKAAGDRLIVARIPREETLLATARAALDRAKGEPSFFRRLTGSASLKPRDTVQIPVVDVELWHAYREIVGHRVLPIERVVEEARQTVRLRLDERGALLKSEVSIGLQKGGALRLPPRRFVCDGPFLVMMIRRGRATPYLALWVDNAELLRPL
jgi:hypothetical protein